jgi:hypothetical protein
MHIKVHRANVKMSQEMKVFLRLLIITSLKKHTIFIVVPTYRNLDMSGNLLLDESKYYWRD